MTKQTTLFAIIFSIVFFIAAQNSFAQCGGLLGVQMGGSGQNQNCPQQPQNPNVDPGKRTVHITDSRAAEIYRAQQNNQRYLITLQSYYENGLLCEERAWVGGATFAGDSSQVVVSVGATKKVCYNPAQPTYSSQQVNQFEAQIDSFTNAYYQWHKYAESCAAYINQYRNNPQAVAYGQSELNRAQQWQTYYQNSITNYRNAINQVAP
ncbi:MAG: hypothetical protein K1X72_10505 [Pyrinomonadaceae bacterium]|nr:hypothetical protein [Pyrinomonadaceae bacterium]